MGDFYNKGEECLFYCPSCEHHKKKLSINIDKNVFKCWVCDWSGRNIYRIIRRYGSNDDKYQWKSFGQRVEIEKFTNKLFGQKTEIEKAIIGMDLSYNDDGGKFGFEIIQKLWPDIQTVRIIGSSALGISYVAGGRTDIYFNYNLKPWDIAAGILLVEESGGIATDRKGQKANLFSEGIIVSNKTLHKSFLEITHNMNWRS